MPSLQELQGKLFQSRKVTVGLLRPRSALRQLWHDRDFLTSKHELDELELLNHPISYTSNLILSTQWKTFAINKL